MVKAYFKRSYKKKATDTKELESLKTSTKLIIVESPSKCRKIEGFLGPQWTCIASKGHIRTIDGLSSIDRSYNITYSMLPDKKEHIDWMKTILSKFNKDNIYLATDDDREGEAIAWHICDVFGLSIEATKRVLFHEITEPAVKAAIERPGHIDINMVKSQMARQVLDILVGFRISPLLWKHLYRNKENSLSAGRCQTPALRLVYENEMEAKAAVIETKYRIVGTFYAKKIDFILSKQLDTSEEVIDFLEKSKTYSHKMTMGTKRETVQQPPKPFSTSSLLQSASSALHMSPKETMSLCQELYQEGHITYMRTESQTYSAVFLSEGREYIHKEYSEVLGENLQSADESNPHEAIRVTHIEAKTIETENGKAATLYKWIWRNTIASCMPAFRVYHTHFGPERVDI
jgi:DNA topoisomerase I